MTKKPKILIFSTAYLPLVGGAEIAVKEITDRIKDYDFDLICARLNHQFKKKERIGQVSVHRIGWGTNFDKILLPISGFLKAFKLYKKQKEKRQVIIWSLMASWGSLSALFFKVFHPQVPFLLTLQEGDSEIYIRKGRFGLINFSWRLLFKKANYIQVISNYLSDLARKFGYQGQIEVVPNGVDLDKFSIGRAKRGREMKAKPSATFNFQFSIKELKEKLGIWEDEKVIITVSRLVEKNGIGDLIEAVYYCSSETERSEAESRTNQAEKLLDSPAPFRGKMLGRSKNKIVLIILGSGPLEKVLKIKTQNLKLEERVLFLGNIPNEEVPKYLSIADLFVRPSLSEGLGSAFLEAMAAGVPIIGTPVGGIPDFLKDGQTGLFCQVKNPKSIAEKINLLLSDENLRQKLIFNGKKMIEEKYDWNIISKKMENIFNRLCAS